MLNRNGRLVPNGKTIVASASRIGETRTATILDVKLHRSYSTVIAKDDKGEGQIMIGVVHKVDVAMLRVNDRVELRYSRLDKKGMPKAPTRDGWVIMKVLNT